MKLVYSNHFKELQDYLFINKQEKVLEAVIKTSFINLIARAFSYGKSVAIAILLGFSYQTDTFFMALSLMGIFLIFVDVFDSVGVPELVKARMKSEEDFKKLAGFLLSFALVLSLTITILAIALMPLILKIPVGFSPEVLTSTKISFILLLPFLFLNFYFHHFGAVLRSQRRFTAFFIGEVIFSFIDFTIILFGLLFYKDYRILPLSISLAQIIATLYIFYIGKKYIHFNFFINETTKKFISQFLKLLPLYGVGHLYILVDRAFASYLGEKMVSALFYGLLLAFAPRGVLKFENIAITSLSESHGSTEKLNFYLKKLFLITLPMVFLFFIFSPFIVRLFFGYGAFSKVDGELTSTAFRFYALSLPSTFFWPLLCRVFQIREKLLTIGIVAFLGVLINAFFNYIFVFLLHLNIVGICLGTFLAFLFICIFGYFMLKF